MNIMRRVDAIGSKLRFLITEIAVFYLFIEFRFGFYSDMAGWAAVIAHKDLSVDMHLCGVDVNSAKLWDVLLPQVPFLYTCAG